MKIEYTVEDSIRDYSATGNRPENSFAPIHAPVHLTTTRRQTQTRVAAGASAIIVDTLENCQAVKNEVFASRSGYQRSVNSLRNDE